jgi:hypothetical protein
MRSLGIHIVAVFTTFSVFYSSLKFFIPLVTDPEQERTSRECAAYMSASRLQSKHYSPFKLIVQISQQSPHKSSTERRCVNSQHFYGFLIFFKFALLYLHDRL